MTRSDEDRARYRAAGWWNDDTPAGLLDRWARAHPDKIAIRDEGREITFATWREQAWRVASGLAARGVGKGDVVALQLPNVPEFLVAFIAVTALGGVVQTLHMPYRGAELRTLLGHSRARAYVGLGEASGQAPAAEARSLLDEIDTLELVVSVGDAAGGTTAFDELLASEPATSLPELAGDDLFLLLYTSGTTGSPKGVPVRYCWFMSNARLAARDWSIGPGDVVLSVAPLTHLYGLWTILLTLYHGAQSALLPVFSPPALVAAVSMMRPTAVCAVPAHVAAMRASGAWSELDPTGIRFMCQAGSIVPAAIAQAIEDKLVGGGVIQLFGMSELQAGVYSRPGDPPETRIHTSGRAPEGMEMRVVDDDDAPLATGAEGHLQLRGIAVFEGYLDNPGATAEAFGDDGWFRTGDTAVIDTQGRMRITGRAKEIINRGGVKYHPSEVEEVVDRLPGVAACAVVPYSDPVLGERACIFVESAGGAAVTLDAVCAALDAAGLAKFKWPERLERIDAMPLTPTRKIIRGRLRQRLD